MKRILLLSAFILTIASLWAAPVTKEQALKEAQQFVSKKRVATNGKRLTMAATPTPLTAATGEQQAYYVFNVGQDDGFVVVSGDDRTPAILGYARQGSFQADHLPPNVKYWFEEYERQIAQLDQVQAPAYQPKERAAIAPLISSSWGQDAPYNLMCPKDPTTKTVCPTGCVATAMAQVMNYHKYPEQTIATIPAYKSESRSIDMPAIGITEIDWENITDHYSASSTAEQKNAVAQLMQLCGSGVKMDYTSGGSGAGTADIVNALVRYFGYDKNLKYLHRYAFTMEEWNDLIYAELEARRPVLYAGYSMGGGHQFVIDGYDRDDFFHVNWGWDGWYDNYFLLSLLNAESNDGTGASKTTDGYSIWQDAVIGVQPPTGQQDYSEILQTVYLYVKDMPNGGDTILARKTDGTFTTSVVHIFIQLRNMTENYELGFGLFDEQGVLVDSTAIMKKRYDLFNTLGATQAISLGKGLPNGNYSIKAMHRLPGMTEWMVNLNSHAEQIAVKLTDNQAILTSGYSDFKADFEILTKNPKAKRDVAVRVTVVNRGTPQRGMFFLGVADWPVGGLHYELEHNDTIQLDFTFKPNNYGTHKLSLMIDSEDDSEDAFTSLADTTIVIEERADIVADGIYYMVTSETDKTLEVDRKGAPDDAYQGSVVIPASVTHDSVTYRVTSIAASAFLKRTKLTSISIGDEVTAIGSTAFKDCSALKKVGMGRKVRSVEQNAFQNCNLIDTVSIKDVQDWCGIEFGNQFSNPIYSATNYSRKLCIDGQEISGEVVFPEGIKTTGFLAFYDCANITSVVLPESLTLIDRHTFSGCSGLSKVYIPKNVGEIGHSAFIRCKSLRRIELPERLNLLNNFAFSQCTGLLSVRLRSNTPPACKSNNVFDAATYETTLLCVPKGCLEAYQAHDVWGKFKNIEELADDEQPSGIISNASDNSPAATDCYDLRGLHSTQQQKGVILMRQTKKDGTVTVRKLVN